MLSAAAPNAKTLERLGVALLLLAAIVPRLRDVRAPFDRGVDGARGAEAVLAGLNYERLGLGAAGGYPVRNLDLGDRHDAEHRAWDRPERWLVDADQPPLVPLVAYKSIDVLSPRDWDDVWK